MLAFTHAAQTFGGAAAAGVTATASAAARAGSDFTRNSSAGFRRGSRRAAQVCTRPRRGAKAPMLVLLDPGGLGGLLGHVEAELVVLDGLHPGDRDHVVLEPGAEVHLAELDLVAHHMVDLAHVPAVRP